MRGIAAHEAVRLGMARIRRSFAVSEETTVKIERMRELVDCSSSEIVDVAVDLLSLLAKSDIERHLRQAKFRRMVSTPARWRELFWTLLADRLHRPEFKYNARLPYGPREFSGCQVLFLMPNARGIEDGTLAIHIFKNVHTGPPSSRMNSFDVRYRVEDNVSQAVDEVVAWINDNGENS